ncbi:hypothetical protein CEXT_538071 [Caerostris extrusa]|uniref:Uncharacterized protein n=1 Tax=Caerostris extrusa TaxID=172846 RepID=A0AAV4XJJ5_CAEEX|nr:hypothetical protein CEXT_538071 [Caerostris extrusa]
MNCTNPSLKPHQASENRSKSEKNQLQRLRDDRGDIVDSKDRYFWLLAGAQANGHSPVLNLSQHSSRPSNSSNSNTNNNNNNNNNNNPTTNGPGSGGGGGGGGGTEERTVAARTPTTMERMMMTTTVKTMMTMTENKTLVTILMLAVLPIQTG